MQHRRCVLVLSASIAAACGGSADADAPESSSSSAPSAAAAVAAALGGRITAIAGPSGVQSPGLAEGTFLGKGARLESGQALETPKGTLAEFELDGGGRIRLNESTAMTLPSAEHPDALVLTRGEAVVVLPTDRGADAPPVVIQSGDETIRIDGGEVLVRNAGDTRHYAVVQGHAVVNSGEQHVELGPGESIDGPLLPPQTEQPREPLLSLRALEDTDWTHTFDAAAEMADEVPRGVGSLTARRAGSNNERQSLRLTDHRVTVNIAGRIAHTEVEQAFFNDRPVVLEGIYRFPMPGDASISGLSLLVGNSWIAGEIVEKERGRQIFQQIVDATIPRDPALLEWERGSVFKLRVFPIPGRGERRVRLSYTQILPVVGGKLRYRYPLGGTGASDVPIDRFAFVMNVDGRDLPEGQRAEMTTPMLAMDRSVADGIVTLSTEREQFLPTFDLGVDVPVPEDTRTIHTATHLDKDGQAYFMATVQPQFELPRTDAPVHYAFVLDRSHSTSPQLWTVARGVVDAMTEMMDADDRFTVLACDTACDEHPDGLQPPDRPVVDRAQRFLDDQDLAGASDLGGMLVQAREALARADGAAQRVVVYLGDGAPTSGEMAADALAPLVARALSDTRVMAVALGSRSDLTTLGAVVEATGGDLVRADARDDLRALVRELRLRAEVPAVRNVRFDVPEGMAAVRTKNATSLRPGDAVVLAGKLRHPVDGEIVMHAEGPDGPIEQRFPVAVTAARSTASTVASHLPRTWAALQIQHLTKTQGFEAKDEIVALSKDYTVMSRFTSLIVLENDRMFREFNVVREAKNKDQWQGNLPEDREKVTETITPAGEAKPVEEDEDPSGRLGATSQIRGEEPAPKTASSAEEGGQLGLRGQGRGGGGTGDGNLGGIAGGVPGGVVGGEVAGGDAPADNDDLFKGGPSQPFAEPPPPEAPEPEPVPDFDDASGDGETRPRETAKPKKRPMPTSTPSAPSRKAEDKKDDTGVDNPFAPTLDDPIGAGSSSGWGGRRSTRTRDWRPPSLQVREFPRESSRTLAKVEGLQARVQADPTQRRLHGELVRTALVAGHPRLGEFARAWAEVDPDHAPALRSLADALATTGDPLALRAYESVLEVTPFSKDEHARLADAFENKGDLRRSCSHRRAVVSIDPARVEHQAELMACLQKAGRRSDADLVREAFLARRAESGSSRVDAVAAELERKAAAATLGLHSGAQLKATLRWTGEEDFDIAVVDRQGRRLSAMRPDRFVRVVEGRGTESLTMRQVRSAVFVEVTRLRPPHGGAAGPSHAVLELTAGGRTRRIDVDIASGSSRVAKVFWSR